MIASHSTESPDDLASRLTANGVPVWLRVGHAFDGYQAALDVNLVYDAQAIRHFGREEPAAGLIRPGQRAPDASLPSQLVMPGLIEAHAHLFLEGGEQNPERRTTYLQLPAGELLGRASERLPRLRRLGIIAVRDAGDKDGVGLALQNRYRSAPKRGAMPYVDSPGAAIHREGRYGRFMGGPIETYDSIEDCVAARIVDGAHRIKLLATGIINFERGAVVSKPQLGANELRRAVEVAHAAGRQTFAHCSGNDGANECITAGVDTIEHGFFVDETQLARMRDANIAWVPTFAPVQYQLDAAARLGWSATAREHLRRILDGHARSLCRAHEIGVRVIAGSDAGSHGVPHGHGFLRELELMQAAGLPAVAVLRAATGAAASRLQFGESFGVLRRGARPRFLLTSPAVLNDVSVLRTPSTVIFDGEVETLGDNPVVPGM